MAMIFLGKTKCPICNQVLMEGDIIWGLPPISDTLNPLYQYFDQGFHKSCFDNWDKKEVVESILREEIRNS